VNSDYINETLVGLQTVITFILNLYNMLSYCGYLVFQFVQGSFEKYLERLEDPTVCIQGLSIFKKY